MLNNIKNRKESGFTIIEVLIVLAIAGLILLVVFLAVPALQRNSRNTQRKSDISALAGAINEFTSNNGGTAPATSDLTGSGPAIANSKLGFYTSSNVFGNAQTATPPSTVSPAGTTAAAGTLTTDDVQVYIGYDCSNGSAAAPKKASSRSIAIEYAVEAAGNPIVQCSQS